MCSKRFVGRDGNMGQEAFTPGFGISRDLIIDAICGRYVPDYGMPYEKLGLAVFCGNQHNPEWRWDRRALERISLPQLCELYNRLTAR